MSQDLCELLYMLFFYYLSEDVSRHTSGHEDGAQLLQ